MEFQRHNATAQLTDMDSTMKKYSSGMVAMKGSNTPSPRRKRMSEPNFSNMRRETRTPGMAKKMSTTPMPSSKSSAPSSPPPWNMRPANRRNIAYGSTEEVRQRIGQSSLERIFLQLVEDTDVTQVANEIVDVVVSPS